jgi:hypothetical protein
VVVRSGGLVLRLGSSAVGAGFVATSAPELVEDGRIVESGKGAVGHAEK